MIRPLAWMLLSAMVGGGSVMTTAMAASTLNKYRPTLNKTDQYISNGVFQGGDRSLEHSQVLNIRRGSPVLSGNAFERVVIDLDVNQKGSQPSVLRAPYYEVAVMPEQNRVQVSIRGNAVPKTLESTIRSHFSKPGLFKSIQLLPKVEDDLWLFTLTTAEGVELEVFEQPFAQGSAPVRIVLDAKKNPLKAKVTETVE